MYRVDLNDLLNDLFQLYLNELNREKINKDQVEYLSSIIHMLLDNNFSFKYNNDDINKFISGAIKLNQTNLNSPFSL